ncbi:RNA-directed DNA polymerase from mobile element jockey [Stylophora pistillata]|uniref:RNA-directed DNA polymerase from mobile element jockey n=1 Tax=Stylophora pistillata TaxID=50429 RepID=A0A2B4RAP8_STYPI|nr:RNA-directed DNA polymerase from mobile element jockey [Stylophora pistillata]
MPLYKKYNADLFVTDLAKEEDSLLTIFDQTDVDSNLNILKDTLQSVLSLHAPVKQIKLRSRPCHFLNQEIKDLMRSRDLLLKQYIQSRHDTEWINFKHSRDLVKKTLQEAEKDYTFEEVTANKNSSGSLWKIINRAIPSKDKQRPAFTKDLKVLANEFDQFFAKVDSNATDAVQRLREEHDITVRDSSSETDTDTSSMESFNLRTVSLEEVRQIVRFLPMNISPGPYKISARVLKDCLPVILGPFTDIIYCSILTNTFPFNWKEAQVIPILRDGDHEKAANNRPRSMLAVVSKVLERIVLNQFSAYLTNSNRLTTQQSGNKNAHSTETLSILLTDNILEAIDKKLITTPVLLDPSKAFDSIDHAKLLHKLFTIGAPHSTVVITHCELHAALEKLQQDLYSVAQ